MAVKIVLRVEGLSVEKIKEKIEAAKSMLGLATGLKILEIQVEEEK